MAQAGRHADQWWHPFNAWSWSGPALIATTSRTAASVCSLDKPRTAAAQRAKACPGAPPRSAPSGHRIAHRLLARLPLRQLNYPAGRLQAVPLPVFNCVTHAHLVCIGIAARDDAAACDMRMIPVRHSVLVCNAGRLEYRMQPCQTRSRPADLLGRSAQLLLAKRHQAVVEVGRCRQLALNLRHGHGDVGIVLLRRRRCKEPGLGIRCLGRS